MTLDDLYEKISASLPSALRYLANEERVSKYILKFPDDPSFLQLKDAYACRDTKQIFYAAHTLKGVSAYLGLTKIENIAVIITEAYRPPNVTGLCDADFEQLMKELETLYTNSVQYIQNYSNEL